MSIPIASVWLVNETSFRPLYDSFSHVNSTVEYTMAGENSLRQKRARRFQLAPATPPITTHTTLSARLGTPDRAAMPEISESTVSFAITLS